MAASLASILPCSDVLNRLSAGCLLTLKKVLAEFYIETIIVTIMATNTQFAIAAHLMAALAYRQGTATTSAELAMSVNTSPSFIRRTLARLAKSGLVKTTTGKTGSCRLERKPERISLLDIYKAVDAPKVFAIHTYPDQKACVVSCCIKKSLGNALQKTQAGMEVRLGKISLAEILADMKS